MARTLNDLVLQGVMGDLDWQADEIHAERVRAHKKHDGPDAMSMERKEYTDWRWMPVMLEELGEIARVLNDREAKMRVGVPEHMIMADLRKETIQLMAMASAFIDAIDMHDMSDST